MSPKHGPLSGGSAQRLPVKKVLGQQELHPRDGRKGGGREGVEGGVEGGEGVEGGTVPKEFGVYLTLSEIKFSILYYSA